MSSKEHFTRKSITIQASLCKICSTRRKFESISPPCGKIWENQIMHHLAPKTLHTGHFLDFRIRPELTSAGRIIIKMHENSKWLIFPSDDMPQLYLEFYIVGGCSRYARSKIQVVSPNST